MHEVHNKTQFLTNSVIDRQPVQLLQSWSYVVTQAKVENKPSCCVQCQPYMTEAVLMLSHSNMPYSTQTNVDGADLCFLSPQPDTSLHSQTMDTELVHHAVCLFTLQLLQVLITPMCGGWPG